MALLGGWAAIPANLANPANWGASRLGFASRLAGLARLAGVRVAFRYRPTPLKPLEHQATFCPPTTLYASLRALPSTT